MCQKHRGKKMGWRDKTYQREPELPGRERKMPVVSWERSPEMAQ